MDKHEHGSVDVSTNEKSLARFAKAVAWTVVIILAFLLFLGIVNG